MNRRALLLGMAALATRPALASPPVTLPQRIRIAGAQVHVTPTGQDLPNNGLAYDRGFATVGYAMEWCAANLDPGNVPPAILVDQNCIITSNPFSSSGVIHLRDLMTPGGDWTEAVPTITGASNGVAIDPAAWGPHQPGPLIAGNGINAVCGVGCNTVWLVRCMQLQSTLGEVVADRGSKLNIGCLAHGGFGRPYPSPAKVNAEYGGSVEDFGGSIVTAGGKYLYSATQNALVIGVEGETPMGPGTPPVIRAGAVFSERLAQHDGTSSLSLPSGWLPER